MRGDRKSELPAFSEIPTVENLYKMDWLVSDTTNGSEREDLLQQKRQMQDRQKAIDAARAYLEKDRTNIGWKALLNDPDIDEAFKINRPLHPHRRRLLSGMQVTNGKDQTLHSFDARTDLNAEPDSKWILELSERFHNEDMRLDVLSRQTSALLFSIIDGINNFPDMSFTKPHSLQTGSRSSLSRRGRGQRKNRAYWKGMVSGDDVQNPFERDCLFSNDDGALTIPATSYMDSGCAVPRCMSMKCIRELGLESQLSEDFEDPGPVNIGVNRQQVKMTRIVRNISFRLKGSSMTFKGDFYVSELLDSVFDVLFGWHFMCNEAAGILEKAQKVYQDARACASRAAAAVSAKIEEVASAAQRRVSDFVSGISSLPPPPYSLVSVLEGDFLVTPRLM